ncbi:hypothetical protein JCM8097_003292 [Rhodosporidiobolus ruineniae]
MSHPHALSEDEENLYLDPSSSFILRRVSPTQVHLERVPPQNLLAWKAKGRPKVLKSHIAQEETQWEALQHRRERFDQAFVYNRHTMDLTRQVVARRWLGKVSPGAPSLGEWERFIMLADNWVLRLPLPAVLAGFSSILTKAQGAHQDHASFNLPAATEGAFVETVARAAFGNKNGFVYGGATSVVLFVREHFPTTLALWADLFLEEYLAHFAALDGPRQPQKWRQFLAAVNHPTARAEEARTRVEEDMERAYPNWGEVPYGHEKRGWVESNYLDWRLNEEKQWQSQHASQSSGMAAGR